MALTALACCSRPAASFAADGLRLAILSDDLEASPAAAQAPGGLASVLVDLSLVGGGCLVGSLAMAWRSRRRDRMHPRIRAADALRFAQLVERCGDTVFRRRGPETSISSAMSARLGYTSEELRTVDPLVLVHGEDRDLVRAALRAIHGGHQRRDLTCRILRGDGEPIWVEMTLFLIDGAEGAPETVWALRDISDRRREADALRLAIQTAREAQAEATQANQAKGDFLASMSHEIRTPLNAIIGFADVLLAMPDLSAAVRRHIERIKGGGDALLTIVNDILDLSQAESGSLRLDPRPFALPLLVDECLALVEPSALAKRLALRVDLSDRFPTGLMGDDGRLRQILLNLLNNAIKFTPHGHVSLRIGYDRARGPNVVRFEISDTGIGIAQDDIAHLFQRFRQVDGTIRRTYGGTGLGLAISKTLVERMNGEIGVQSEKGVGSTFWFAIDMPPASLVLERPAAPPRAACRPLDILLVEDVTINQELACALLEEQGHKVDVVSDGADAIMAVQHSAYDLVLMDVQMPKVDGITATLAIRNLGAPCRFVPIVAMTAAVLKEQTKAAREAGMDDVLAKPLSLTELDALLERASRDAVRPAPDPTAFDSAIATNLAATIGDAKVCSMQTLLVKSLSARFTAPLTTETLAVQKAEAHASIAGPAMLGFPRFAAACRAFIAAPDLEAAGPAYAALRRELYHVVRLAEAATHDAGVRAA